MRISKITVGLHPPAYYSLHENSEPFGSYVYNSHGYNEAEPLYVEGTNYNSNRFKITVGYFSPKPNNNVDSKSEHTSIDRKVLINNESITNESEYGPKSGHCCRSGLSEIARGTTITSNCTDEKISNDMYQPADHKDASDGLSGGSGMLSRSVRNSSLSEQLDPHNKTPLQKESMFTHVDSNSTLNVQKPPKVKRTPLDILRSKVKMTQNLLKFTNGTSDFIPKLLEMNNVDGGVEYTFDRLKTNPMFFHTNYNGLNASSSIEESRMNVIDHKVTHSIGSIANAKLTKINVKYKEYGAILKDLDKNYKSSNDAELVKLKNSINSLCLTKGNSPDEPQNKTPKLWIKDSNTLQLRVDSSESYPIGLRALFNNSKSGIASTPV